MFFCFDFFLLGVFLLQIYQPGSATANNKLRITIQGTHTGHISWQFLCYLSLGPVPAASSCARLKCSCMIWPRFRMLHSKWSSNDLKHQWSPTSPSFALFCNQRPNIGSIGNPTKKLSINYIILIYNYDTTSVHHPTHSQALFGVLGVTALDPIPAIDCWDLYFKPNSFAHCHLSWVGGCGFPKFKRWWMLEPKWHKQAIHHQNI